MKSDLLSSHSYKHQVLEYLKQLDNFKVQGKKPSKSSHYREDNMLVQKLTFGNVHILWKP